MCINFPHRIRTFCPCERSQLYDVWLQNCFFFGFFVFVWCVIISQEISAGRRRRRWKGVNCAQRAYSECVRVRFDRASVSCIQFQFRYLHQQQPTRCWPQALQTIQTTTNNINIYPVNSYHTSAETVVGAHTQNAPKNIQYEIFMDMKWPSEFIILQTLLCIPFLGKKKKVILCMCFASRSFHVRSIGFDWARF